MKEWLRKVFAWILEKAQNDKVLHFVFGAVIAAVVYIVMFFGIRATGANYHAVRWISIACSMFVVTGTEAIKEFYIDVKPDWKDFLFTELGGLVVWIIAIL